MDLFTTVIRTYIKVDSLKEGKMLMLDRDRTISRVLSQYKLTLTSSFSFIDLE